MPLKIISRWNSTNDQNHSFSDGNKRIAAFLFLWFMERNGILYNADTILGTK